jgi:hypothetical protein
MGEAFTRHSLRPLAFEGTLTDNPGAMRRGIAIACPMLFEP